MTRKQNERKSLDVFCFFQEWLTGVLVLIDVLYRPMGKGSLLARRIVDGERNECSEMILSRLDVRFKIDMAGVDIAQGIGNRECFISESSK